MRGCPLQAGPSGQASPADRAHTMRLLCLMLPCRPSPWALPLLLLLLLQPLLQPVLVLQGRCAVGRLAPAAGPAVDEAGAWDRGLLCPPFPAAGLARAHSCGMRPVVLERRGPAMAQQVLQQSAQSHGRLLVVCPMPPALGLLPDGRQGLRHCFAATCP